jgi:hypothetical protein
MEHHEQVAHGRIERAREQFLDATVSVQLYGKPSEGILQKTKQLEQSGIPLIMKPNQVDGFMRLAG